MIVDCPECGHEVSTSAAACPYCAYPVATGTPMPESSVKPDNFWRAWGVNPLEVTKQIVGRLIFGGV